MSTYREAGPRRWLQSESKDKQGVVMKDTFKADTLVATRFLGANSETRVSTNT
jgi:hypothetical protein